MPVSTAPGFGDRNGGDTIRRKSDIWKSSHNAGAFGSARVWIAFVVSAATAGVVVGGVLGVSTQVALGPNENGQGAYVSEAGLAYWSWEQTHVGPIPNPVPPRVSLAKAAPSILPAGATRYAMNPAARGQPSVEWSFQEGTTTPPRTELEIRFVDGLSQPAAAFTVYVESQNAIPGGPVVFNFYWASPPFPPAFFTIETMQSSVLVCTAIGVCP